MRFHKCPIIPTIEPFNSPITMTNTNPESSSIDGLNVAGYLNREVGIFVFTIF